MILFKRKNKSAGENQAPRNEFAKVDVLLARPGRGQIGEDRMLSIIRGMRPEKPTVLLFSEDAPQLGKIYPYSYSDAEWLSHKIKLEKPSSLTVVFCAQCHGPSLTRLEPENRIFVVGDFVEWRPKYVFTEWDSQNAGVELGGAEFRRFEEKWRGEFEKQAEPFITREIDGVRLQFRVCADVLIDRKNDRGAITLVSAAGLPMEEVMGTQKYRKKPRGIIINDSKSGKGDTSRFASGAYVPAAEHNYWQFYCAEEKYSVPQPVMESLEVGIGRA